MVGTGFGGGSFGGGAGSYPAIIFANDVVA
jgi:hypothetical protein